MEEGKTLSREQSNAISELVFLFLFLLIMCVEIILDIFKGSAQGPKSVAHPWTRKLQKLCHLIQWVWFPKKNVCFIFVLIIVW